MNDEWESLWIPMLCRGSLGHVCCHQTHLDKESVGEDLRLEKEETRLVLNRSKLFQLDG